MTKDQFTPSEADEPTNRKYLPLVLAHYVHTAKITTCIIRRGPSTGSGKWVACSSRPRLNQHAGYKQDRNQHPEHPETANKFACGLQESFLKIEHCFPVTYIHFPFSCCLALGEGSLSLFNDAPGQPYPMMLCTKEATPDGQLVYRLGHVPILLVEDPNPTLTPLCKLLRWLKQLKSKQLAHLTRWSQDGHYSHCPLEIFLDFTQFYAVSILSWRPPLQGLPPPEKILDLLLLHLGGVGLQWPYPEMFTLVPDFPWCIGGPFMVAYVQGGSVLITLIGTSNNQEYQKILIGF